MITDGVGEMGETKWTFHETPFFGRWRPWLVGRVRGTEGQAASGPAKPTLRASSGHAIGGDALSRDSRDKRLLDGGVGASHKVLEAYMGEVV